MARVELIMPKLGESVMEATILSWAKKVGDTIAQDENIATIATDKVDTDVPSPIAGTVVEILYPEGTTVAIGKAIAIVETEAAGGGNANSGKQEQNAPVTETTKITVNQTVTSNNAQPATTSSNRFYSPLVKNIAKEENVSTTELDAIAGTGENGRVTKKDMLQYLENRGKQPTVTQQPQVQQQQQQPQQQKTVAVQQFNPPPVDRSGNVEIIEMDRMRKLIAEHMVMSKHVSPHVTSFVEADVTNLVRWREKNKGAFEQRYGEKITFTPIFIEAVVKAIQDYPMVNVSVDGTTIIRHKNINIGMAAALPSGNLIVPVIKNADMLNLAGLTKNVNDLTNRSRNNKLRPDEVQGGTFTISNVGTFGNVMGTPIINQPQAAILATGAIRKKPAVLETEDGDVIAIRQMMFLSLSYDHRIVDGALGGSMLRRIADYLEAFDINRPI